MVLQEQFFVLMVAIQLQKENMYPGPVMTLMTGIIFQLDLPQLLLVELKEGDILFQQDL